MSRFTKGWFDPGTVGRVFWSSNIASDGACAHYVMVSKFQWKPCWLATHRDAQNDWNGWRNRVNYNVFTRHRLGPIAQSWFFCLSLYWWQAKMASIEFWVPWCSRVCTGIWCLASHWSVPDCPKPDPIPPKKKIVGAFLVQTIQMMPGTTTPAWSSWHWHQQVCEYAYMICPNRGLSCDKTVARMPSWENSCDWEELAGHCCLVTEFSRCFATVAKKHTGTGK